MKYLFVCGAPRSGTTLLARLLGSNGHVVLGIERFKGLLGRDDFNSDLFEKERFFDFREADTNIDYEANRKHYDAAFAKYDSAIYAGDKIPNMYKRILKVNERFGGNATFIFCYRNLYEVAASWNVRANNPMDKWPQENNYSKAVEAWVSSFRHALRAKAAGVNVVPFNYNALVGQKSERTFEYYAKFVGSLGLDLTEGDRQALKSELAKFPAIQKKREDLTHEMVSEIKGQIDLPLMLRFIKVFRVGRVGMLPDVQEAWAEIVRNKQLRKSTALYV